MPEHTYTIKAQCFCTKSSLEVQMPFTNPGGKVADLPKSALPKPYLNVICHCTVCQRLHGAPFVHLLGFDASQVHPSADTLKAFKTSAQDRFFCTNCYTRLYNEPHAPIGGVKVRDFPATLLVEDENSNKLLNEGLLKDAVHIFYADRATDVKDGLPKFKEFPGSEEMKESE